jgi:hypothetical protein
MRWTVVLVLLAVTMVACRPRPTFEYEPPVTITHTDAPGDPGDAGAPAAPVTSTTVPPRPSSWVHGGTSK